MPLRRKNLLDAFRRVNDPTVPGTAGARTTPAVPPNPARPVGVTPAPEGAPHVPRPTPPVDVTPAPEGRPHQPSPRPPAGVLPEPEHGGRAAPPTRLDPPAAPPPTPPRERLVLLSFALAVAVLALVYVVRRGGSEDTVAAQGNASAANRAATNAAPGAAMPPAARPSGQPSAQPTAPPSGASEPQRAPHDAALHDPRNRFTVRLIQYPNDDKGLALALEAHRWLVKFGYPVGSPIRLGSGKGIVLVASAKPTSEELVPLRDNLRRLRYPENSKAMPFADAYIDEIDDVLARSAAPQARD